jgi:hypothetical protein
VNIIAWRSTAMKETHPLFEADGKKYTNLAELEALAKKYLTTNAFGYYASGAEVRCTLTRSPHGPMTLARHAFAPALRGCEHRSCTARRCEQQSNTPPPSWMTDAT